VQLWLSVNYPNHPMEPAEEAQAYHCKIKVYNSTGNIEKAQNKLPL